MIKWFVVSIVVMILGACSILPGRPSQAAGILQGKVSVGPLQPVERAGVTPPPPPAEVYTSRGIAIYSENGATLVKSLHFNPDGTYQVELQPGKYLVKLIPSGIDRSKEIPAGITIISGGILKLDINIDTGIR